MWASMGRNRIPSVLLNWGRKAAGGRMKSSIAETGKEDPAAVRQQLEAASREDRLDFLTAAKILFSTPAKPKKFGVVALLICINLFVKVIGAMLVCVIEGFLLVPGFSRLDFHLWQFFAACLPPFAVYLTAQYSRYEMRRLEKEKEEAEKVLLQTVVAEEIASRLTGGGDKTVSEESANRASANKELPQKEDGRKPEGTAVGVQVPVEDLQEMKMRLEALEKKFSRLEGAHKETGVEATPKSQPTSVIRPEGMSPSLSAQYEPKLQRTDQEIGSTKPEMRERTALS
ncbi:hypothetical protein R1sor_006580 [Riccia sorocarpa]|uniref:Uncharacterized protein n=1 Tax=Riccia sorocarpa TaxID=122646 RepID=A0ABD3HU90_9MARC